MASERVVISGLLEPSERVAGDVFDYAVRNDVAHVGMFDATGHNMHSSVIGSLALYEWFNEIRNGNQNALRTVTISLQNEDHSEVVMTWKLLRARIIKHSSGPLNGKGTDVAMEEIVLAYERLELE